MWSPERPGVEDPDTRKAWKTAFKNLFFPIFCMACRERLFTEENGYFCATCWELAPRIEPPLCTLCGRPHETMTGLGNRRNFPCAACREKPLKAVHRIHGAALYEDAIAEAIKLLKFHDKQRLALPLGALLVEHATRYLDVNAYDLLVPVPLHRVRLRERGYNQSALLAKAAAPAFPQASVWEGLKRIRPTRTQSKLAGKRRSDNVKGAFAVVGDEASGKRILLIDDVVTSGGTVEACAKALLRAGALRVEVLAVTLAVRHGIP
jgi:ComF family protein